MKVSGVQCCVELIDVHYMEDIRCLEPEAVVARTVKNLIATSYILWDERTFTD